MRRVEGSGCITASMVCDWRAVGVVLARRGRWRRVREGTIDLSTAQQRGAVSIFA